MIFYSLFELLLILTYSYSVALPDRGKWSFVLTPERSNINVASTLFKGSQLIIQISCEPLGSSVDVEGVLFKWPCLRNVGDDENGEVQKLQMSQLIDDSLKQNLPYVYIKFPNNLYLCSDHILKGICVKPFITTNEVQEPAKHQDCISPFFLAEDGFYVLYLEIIKSKQGKDDLKEGNDDFNASVHIKMRGPYGYLSAIEWPLLHFYEAMCVVYVLFAIAWLTVSFLQWRDLLRIQFWIGAVILIGMVEKAMFYEEYQSINTTGESSLLGTVFPAELVSAAKRSLARMLVIIVSLGYGIVKPRLGSHLPKIIGTGVLFFILASTEAYLRVTGTRTNPSKFLFVASVPLALLDSFICWWIFSSLIQTTRTLRLRRNLVKITLYNYFTNTLIFAVIASFIFMIYSIKVHRSTTECSTDWKELWIDDAFWHLLFSIILLVIMILWRPTNNNQRYAFSPLLDAPDDEGEDDEEIEHFVNDSYGVKMRGMGSSRSDSPKLKNNMDEDLKWVEEHIPPSFINSTLPILDSDEELMNTRFEISKME